MPVPGDNFPSMLLKVIGVCIGALALPVSACEFPDEGGMPLRRAVTRVQMLPEVDAWHRAMEKNGITPHYVVQLDAPVQHNGRCYWPVEVTAGGKLWKRLLVSPDGKSILND